MQRPSGDYFDKRAAELGLDRQPIIEAIQAELDRLYPGQIRTTGLNGGVLRLVTESSAVASDLRLRQINLMIRFRKLSGSKYPIDSLNIQIKTL